MAMNIATKRYFIFVGVTFGLFTLMFGLAEAFDLHLLQSLGEMAQLPLALAGLAGVGLLIADIILPIPSTLVMMAMGALFGFWAGMLLAFVGGVGAAMTGYYLGKSGRKWIQRVFKIGEFEKGRRFFERWGSLSVIVSRPVPLIAETVSVVAGASGMRALPMLLGSVLGVLPAAAIYAWAGANFHGSEGTVGAFFVVLGVAAVFFVVLKLFQRDRKQP
ncbi:MAG: VTT domain-containing protein [Bacteroidota bacterium]